MSIQRKDHFLNVGRKHDLAYAKFIPKETFRAALLISSATGVPQEFYWKFAQFLAKNGIVTYTFDYSGTGRSGSSIKELKSHAHGVKGWGSIDQMNMTSLVLKENPGMSINLATHSIGGQILGFNPLNHRFDKVVMAASQSAAWHAYKGYSKFKLYLFFNFFIPVLTPIFGYYPGAKVGIFENLPGSMALEWCKWGNKKEYMMHYHNPEDYFFEKLRAKVRSFSFSNDWLASQKGVDWLANQYSNAEVERVHYKDKVNGIEPKHFGFYKENFREVFWESTLTWLLE